jgi:hypothetical protein
VDAAEERALAAALFNGVWTLLDKPDRTADDDDAMLHMAHASRHHWGRVGAPVNLVRGEWQCARVYAVLGRPEPALHHARRCLELCERHGIGGFDLAYAHEALARAAAVAGDAAGSAGHLTAAREVTAAIDDDGDRAQVEADLATVPRG